MRQQSSTGSWCSMAKTRTLIPSGAWPRLMRVDMVAAYLDVSPATVKAKQLAGDLPAPSHHNPPRWDKNQLDDWLDGPQDGPDARQRHRSTLVSLLDHHDYAPQKRPAHPL